MGTTQPWRTLPDPDGHNGSVVMTWLYLDSKWRMGTSKSGDLIIQAMNAGLWTTTFSQVHPANSLSGSPDSI